MVPVKKQFLSTPKQTFTFHSFSSLLVFIFLTLRWHQTVMCLWTVFYCVFIISIMHCKVCIVFSIFLFYDVISFSFNWSRSEMCVVCWLCLLCCCNHHPMSCFYFLFFAFNLQACPGEEKSAVLYFCNKNWFSLFSEHIFCMWQFVYLCKWNPFIKKYNKKFHLKTHN